MTAKIIVFANDKGGVGKTTSTVTLGYGLANRGRRVLIVDMDPQGQCATTLGMIQEAGVFNALIRPDQDLNQWIRTTGRKDLALLPGDRTTATAQVVLNAEHRPVNALRALFQVLSKQYDYIVADTAPSVGGIQERALFAADLVVIPTATEFLSIEGLSQVLTNLGNLRDQHRWRGRLLGILPTFFDEQTRESKSSLEQLEEAFPETILPPIHRATLLRECAADGKIVFEKDPQSRATREYEALVSLVVRKS
jgi:chromosome partitioning protein